MIKNKKLAPIIMICTLLVMVVAYFQSTNTSIDATMDKTNIIFGNNYISYVFDDQGDSFNLFGIHKLSDKSILDHFEDISFNNENIEIKSFKLEKGFIKNNYQLFNIIVDVKVLSDDVENADQIIILFDDNTTQAYDLGKLTLQNIGKFNEEDIVPKGGYTTVYPYPSLDVHLLNNSEETLYLNKITDLNGLFQYAFTANVKVGTNETFHLVIEEFNQEGNYDFYQITPILHYSSSDGIKHYHMPGVLYRALIPDEEKINLILNLPTE